MIGDFGKYEDPEFSLVLFFNEFFFFEKYFGDRMTLSMQIKKLFILWRKLQNRYVTLLEVDLAMILECMPMTKPYWCMLCSSCIQVLFTFWVLYI